MEEQQGTTILQNQLFSVNTTQQGQLQNQLAMNRMNATYPVSSAAALALVRTFYYLKAVNSRGVSRTLSNICLVGF